MGGKTISCFIYGIYKTYGKDFSSEEYTKLSEKLDDIIEFIVRIHNVDRFITINSFDNIPVFFSVNKLKEKMDIKNIIMHPCRINNDIDAGFIFKMKANLADALYRPQDLQVCYSRNKSESYGICYNYMKQEADILLIIYTKEGLPILEKYLNSFGNLKDDYEYICIDVSDYNNINISE